MMLTRTYAPEMFERFPALGYVFFMTLFSGVIVNLMNLVPVLPLDGGQIMATLVNHYWRRGQKATILSLQISIGSAIAVALWCAYCSNTGHDVVPSSLYSFLPRQHASFLSNLQPDPKFLMIFFGILGAQSLISYNSFKSWR
jgi:Zn-dependent protease